jgi:hypothetical protein
MTSVATTAPCTASEVPRLDPKPPFDPDDAARVAAERPADERGGGGACMEPRRSRTDGRASGSVIPPEILRDR